MNPSKLNINSFAKEKIRKSFLSSRSLKRKTPEESDTCADSSTEESSRSSDASSEPKMKQERKHVTVPGLNEGVLFVEKEDGFPMITSVYSLATCDAHQEKDSASEIPSDIMNTPQLPSEKLETRIQTQTVCGRNVTTTASAATSNISNLPFVVQCNNGVITVCSPPRVPGTVTITNPVTSSPRDSKQAMHAFNSTVPSNAQVVGIFGETNSAFSVCDTGTPLALPINKLPQCSVNNSESTIVYQHPDVTITPSNNQPILPKSSQLSEVNSCFKKGNQRPILPKPNLPTSVVNNTNEEINLQLNKKHDKKIEDKEKSPLNEEATSSSTAAIFSTEAQMDEVDMESEEASSSPIFDHPMQDETEEPILVTKQDDRIRRLKDLLHKQEQELERVRFKGEGEKSDSRCSKTLVSSQKPLRIKLLKKHGGKGLCVPKACTRIDTQSERSISGPATNNTLSQKELSYSMGGPVELEKEPLRVTTEVPRSASTHKQVTSPLPKWKHNAPELQQPNVSADPDKYRLVNVTVVEGHTRTLAVPVDSKNEPTALLKKQVRGTTVQKVDKMAKTDTKGKCPRKLAQTNQASKPTASTQSSSSNSMSVLTTTHPNHLYNSISDITTKDISGTTVTHASNDGNFAPDVSSEHSSEPGTTKNNAIPTKALWKHLCQTSSINTSNATKKADIVPTEAAGTHIAKSSAHSSPTRQTLGTLKFPLSHTVNSSFAASNILNASTAVTHGFQLQSSTTKLPMTPTNTLPRNINKLPTINTFVLNPNVGFREGSTLFNSACASHQSLEVRPVSLSTSTLQTIQNQVYAINTSACISNTPSQGVTSVNTNDQPIISPSSRPLYSLAPKPPSVLAQANSTVIQKNLVIYSLQATPVVSSGSVDAFAKLNNVSDGKIVICNMVPPKTTPNLGEAPVLPANNNGNMLFYVSNQGVSKKLGIIQDKRVLLNSAKPCLSPKKLVEVNGKSPVKSDPEFIPNPNDVDFTKLVGLERVVCSLNTDR